MFSLGQIRHPALLGVVCAVAAASAAQAEVPGGVAGPWGEGPRLTFGQEARVSKTPVGLSSGTPVLASSETPVALQLRGTFLELERQLFEDTGYPTADEAWARTYLKAFQERIIRLESRDYPLQPPGAIQQHAQEAREYALTVAGEPPDLQVAQGYGVRRIPWG